MKLALVVAPVVVLTILALTRSPAVAAPGPGCLSTPLPSGTGGNPSFSMVVEDVADQMHVTLWRQRCQDSQDSVLLLRVAPTSTSPLVCANRWYLDQDGTRFFATFYSAITGATGTGPAFCDRISAPVTVIVDSAGVAGGEEGTFEIDDDFALLFYGSFGGPYVVFTLDVPYAGSSSPTITVVSTGCNPCHSGQTVGFNGNVDNPGPAMQAEIKAGARLPDGTIVSLVNKVVTLPSGASVFTLIPPQALPGGLPMMDLPVEAAILEPALGATLSRHKVTLRLMP